MNNKNNSPTFKLKSLFVSSAIYLMSGAAWADILINEVDADQTSTDTAEFIELTDGGAGNTDLSGINIVLINGSNDSIYKVINLDGQTTSPTGYFVVCGNSETTENCDLDVSPNSNLIQNGADAIAIISGDFTIDTPITSDNLIDALVYDTNDSDDVVLLSLLTPGQPQVNEDGTIDKDIESNQRCADSTGGAFNTSVYEQHLPTPGEYNLCGGEPVVDIVINEVDADQTITDSAEFVELFDGGSGNNDLSGLSIALLNGNGDSVYRTYALDGFETNSEGYFVLCANAENTPNCDLDVSPDTNLIQNGADAVAVVSGPFTNDTPITTDNLVDAVVYDTNDADDIGLLALLTPEQTQVNEDELGSKDTHSNQRCEVSALSTSLFQQASPTPGQQNSCGSSNDEQFGVCYDPATLIHTIQGSDEVSPLNGNSGVIIEGVVTASFQASGQLNGYYIQEEDGDHDNSTFTSEGLFVSDTSTIVTAGDLVRIQGTVSELYELTSLTNITQTVICAEDVPASTSSITMPVNTLDEFEAVEGMLVSVSNTLQVASNYNLSRYGEVVLSDQRMYQFTHANEPSVDGYATHQVNLSRNQIILDDGLSAQNPDVVVYPAPSLSANNTLRAGDSALISGVMSYGFGSYRIQPTTPIVFTQDNPRSEIPADVGGNFKAASINVLNYFTTIDENGALCGPSSLSCRGANSTEEFTRQRTKITEAIHKIDADLIGLVELENNAQASLSDLVDGLNEVAGPNTYAYVNTGTIGTDAIKVGIIYKPASATLTGNFAILDSSVDPLFIDTKNRPSLAQSFTTMTGETFTVAVNHLKSKGSNCDSIGDPDLNDGQGNCALTRANASAALVDWLASDPTGSEDNDFLILGDLNAYAKEEAITRITDNGFTNLVEAFGGELAYSYIFNGELGYLDHALASAELSAKVTGVTEWHINADEPRALDYNLEFQTQDQQNNFYAPDAYRMSDHDPVVIGFNFAPAALTGDFDGDGDVDINDIYGLMRAIQMSQPIEMSFDLNNDGFITMMDARVMMSLCTNAGCA